MKWHPGIHGWQRHAIFSIAFVIAGCGGGAPSAPYTDEQGNFRVLVVGTTKQSREKLLTKAGELTMVTMENIDGNNTTRSVTYSDYPPQSVQSKSPDAMLDGAVRRMTTGGDWNVQDQKPIELDGHPGAKSSFR